MAYVNVASKGMLPINVYDTVEFFPNIRPGGFVYFLWSLINSLSIHDSL